MNPHTVLTATAVAAALVAVGSDALGQSPDQAADGQIHACYPQPGQGDSTMRIVGATENCRGGEGRVSWQSAGAPGRVGPPGERGPAGPPNIDATLGLLRLASVNDDQYFTQYRVHQYRSQAGRITNVNLACAGPGRVGIAAGGWAMREDAKELNVVATRPGVVNTISFKDERTRIPGRGSESRMVETWVLCKTANALRRSINANVPPLAPPPTKVPKKPK